MVRAFVLLVGVMTIADCKRQVVIEEWQHNSQNLIFPNRDVYAAPGAALQRVPLLDTVLARREFAQCERHLAQWLAFGARVGSPGATPAACSTAGHRTRPARVRAM